MNKEILVVAEAVSNEKSLPKEIIFKTLEKALTLAIKKKYNKKIDIKININRNNGSFKIYRRWIVVEKIKKPYKEITFQKAIYKNKNIKIGEFIKNKIKLEKFDRITTQTAKQIITQKIRKIKKLIILEKIKKKKNHIITGYVKKINKQYITINIKSNLKVILLKKDMIIKDNFKIGDKIKGIIYDIRKKKNKWKIFITRLNKKILIELFKKYVPEIKKKIIEIKAISRTPGLRSKIAVNTKNKHIDPIGACIGLKGLRIKSISNNLSGEKIDIILWNKNPKKFVINSLLPAKISNIKINTKKKSMDINVKITNLAKTIGKNGQNIKLASQLTGWNLNIITTKNKIIN